jgi:hypothetical protein
MVPEKESLKGHSSSIWSEAQSLRMSDKLPDCAIPGGQKRNIPTADGRSAASFVFWRLKVSA